MQIFKGADFLAAVIVPLRWACVAQGPWIAYRPPCHIPNLIFGARQGGVVRVVSSPAVVVARLRKFCIGFWR